MTSETDVSCVSTMAAFAETCTSCVTAPTCSFTLICTLLPTWSVIPDCTYVLNDGAVTSRR